MYGVCLCSHLLQECLQEGRRVMTRTSTYLGPHLEAGHLPCRHLRPLLHSAVPRSFFKSFNSLHQKVTPILLMDKINKAKVSSPDFTYLISPILHANHLLHTAVQFRANKAPSSYLGRQTSGQSHLSCVLQGMSDEPHPSIHYLAHDP